jgi:hypothetical protein
MWHERKLIILLVLGIFFAGPSVLEAQDGDEFPSRVTIQNRTGDLPFSTSIGTDVEHIDVASGNLVVNIPIASVPGRGMGVDVRLRYNRLFWIVGTRFDAYGSPYNIWQLEKRYGIALGWNENRAKATHTSRQVLCDGGASNDKKTYYKPDIYRSGGRETSSGHSVLGGRILQRWGPGPGWSGFNRRRPLGQDEQQPQFLA